MSRYYLGQPFRLALTVRDLADFLVDPATIDLRFLLPDGTQAAGPSPVRDSLGTYHADVPAPAALGPYRYRWLTTGPGAGVSTGLAVVVDPFALEVCSLADAKAQLNIRPDDTAHDDELLDYIAAVPAVVERWVGKLAPTARTEAVTGWPIVLRHTPVAALTSIGWGNTVMDVAGVELDAEAGVIWPLSYPWPGTFTVAYTSGWTVVPAALNLAGRVIVAHWWDSQRAAGTGQVGRSGEDYADANSVPGLGFAVPRYAVELLESLRVHTGLTT